MSLDRTVNKAYRRIGLGLIAGAITISAALWRLGTTYIQNEMYVPPFIVDTTPPSTSQQNSSDLVYTSCPPHMRNSEGRLVPIPYVGCLYFDFAKTKEKQI